MTEIIPTEWSKERFYQFTKQELLDMLEAIPDGEHLYVRVYAYYDPFVDFTFPTEKTEYGFEFLSVDSYP